MEDEMAYMNEHPPRCLGGHVQKPSDKLRKFLRRELGPDSTEFVPVCACSNADLRVTVVEDTALTSITCPACGKTRVIYDQMEHGYDGELGLNKELAEYDDEEDVEEDAGDDADAESAPEQVTCQKCGHDTFQVAACFQYAGETDVLEDDDPPNVKPEDLFGCIMIAAQCVKCGAVQEIAQDECA